MAKDHSLPLRRAICTLLSGTGAITALVSSRVYGETVPADTDWPYVQVGVIIGGPFDATCLDGMEADFAIKSFARGLDGSSAYALGATVQGVVDGAKLTLEGGAHTVSLDWTPGSQILRDPQFADGYYSLHQFKAVTSDDF